MPADEITIAAGVAIAVSLKGGPHDSSDTFQERVPNWDTLTEKQKQTYQKVYFKAVSMKKKMTHMEIMAEVLKMKKAVLN